MDVDRRDWPFWVRLGLWGLPSRGAAWAFFWLSVASAAGSVAAGLIINPFALVGVVFVFAAAWYYLAIRWVDENSRWS